MPDHQDFPPALIAERLHIVHRDTSRPPLFETTFIYEKAHVEGVRGLNSVALGIPGTRIEMDGLTFESMSLSRQPSQFDLTLMMAEMAGLSQPSTILISSCHHHRLPTLPEAVEGITSTPDRQYQPSCSFDPERPCSKTNATEAEYLESVPHQLLNSKRHVD
jgi:hypothetical protein